MIRIPFTDADLPASAADLPPYIRVLLVSAANRLDPNGPPPTPDEFAQLIEQAHERAQARLLEIWEGRTDFAKAFREALFRSTYDTIRVRHAENPPPQDWNPRYVRFAAAHGRTPEEQAAHDTAGGRGMTEFLAWHEEEAPHAAR